MKAYSMIKRKKKLCKCPCGKEGYLWSHGFLKACYHKQCPPKPIIKRTEKKVEQIKEANKYYRWAIGQSIIKNKGVCRCDNCGEEIKGGNGKNVSHIIGNGANGSLYTHPLNHFVFGNMIKGDKCKCEQLFSDEGKRHTMNIYQEYLRRHELLNNEYYENIHRNTSE